MSNISNKIKENKDLDTEVSSKHDDNISIKSNLSNINNSTNVASTFNCQNNSYSSSLLNYYSDFDSKIALREFNEFSPFPYGKLINVDEKTKEKIMNLKTGTKIKTTINVDLEKIKNWKFEQKLKESKLILFL